MSSRFHAVTNCCRSFALAFLFLAAANSRATCPGCVEFGSGVIWGTTTTASLNEASGIAVSAFNPGVIWTHNDDGSDGHVFAFHTNGAWLARFDMNLTLGDVEDMALGPGPINGLAYLYLGDIGGAHKPNEVRSNVTIIRIPEPAVSLTWASNPRNSLDFAGVETFTLQYPDGSYDAETLLLDPVSGDLFVGTKQNSGTRIYRANLNAAANNATLLMEHVITVPFSSASGGSISANGGRIVLRRENFAEMWTRCAGESVADALVRTGHTVPIIGPPDEVNGEAIAFTPDSSGYVTISDSTAQPPIYFFPALCSLTAPGTEIIQQPNSVEAATGSDVQLSVLAGGADLHYQWRFEDADIPNANAATLFLTNVQSGNVGNYSVLVSGAGGSILSSGAFLNVRVIPPVIVTQPINTLAATGTTVHLSVAVQGSAPFSYLWTRGAKKIVSTEPTLSLTNVQHAAGGKYRVVISNSAGKATSAYAKLKVLNPPVITLQPQPKTVVVGSKATLRVRAKGSPHLFYQWLFNASPIPGATKSSLSLKNVQAGQSGQYSVVISNAVGTATSSAAELLVQ